MSEMSLFDVEPEWVGTLRKHRASIAARLTEMEADGTGSWAHRIDQYRRCVDELDRLLAGGWREVDA